MRKKFIFRFCLPAFVGILLIAAFGCTKKGSTPENPIAQVPEIITSGVSEITAYTAKSGGNCSDAGAPVTTKGVCWSTSHNPTTDSPKTNDSSGAGLYSSYLTGLSPNTTYYVRGYATNRLGTGYGNEVIFKTLGVLTVTTTDVTNITPSSATSGGNVTDDGGFAVTSKGVCWDTSPFPILANQNYTQDGSGIGSFISNLTNLTSNTIYYVRAYAVNQNGTTYGNQVAFSNSTLPFFIGKSYGGGVIFYLDNTGQHGLIAATIDQSSGAPWGCKGKFIGGTSWDIGTGQANTKIILGGCPTTGIAARICADLVLNGYNDWYLPSQWELREVYNQMWIIGGFSLDLYNYWSSSEWDANAVGVGGFPSGEFGYGAYKDDNSVKVRAIRSF
jgi:hypothetical protein